MTKKPKHLTGIHAKVFFLFEEIAGADRASELMCLFNWKLSTQIANALVSESDYDEPAADDVAFHCLDWNTDAAFLVALMLFPEKFSEAEIDEGLLHMLIHAPNHLAAGAKLIGHPVSDVFEIGAVR